MDILPGKCAAQILQQASMQAHNERRVAVLSDLPQLTPESPFLRSDC